MEARIPKVGDHVIYHGSTGIPFNALVTAAWGGDNPHQALNVVVISDNDKETDSCGRQIKRWTSLIHKSSQPAHGHYWRWPDEEPNPVVEPTST